MVRNWFYTLISVWFPNEASGYIKIKYIDIKEYERWQNIKQQSRIWGSHGCDYEDGCLLGCSTV
jgi:hypothetical protein